MHINYVLWGISRTGGTVTFTEIGKRLIKKGHKVTITVLDDGYGVMTGHGFKPKWEQDSLIEYIPVSTGNHYGHFLSSAICNMLKPEALPDEWALINKFSDYIPECDINVAMNPSPAFALLLSGKGKSQFYHIQHYAPITVSNYIMDKIVKLGYSQEIEFPFSDDWSTYQPSTLLKKPAALLSKPVRRVIMWNQRAINARKRLAEASYLLPLNRIANSSWLQKTLEKKHGVKSTLITHAIRNDIFYPRPYINKSNHKRILCLGKTNVYWKGISTLVDALKIVATKISDLELVLYGSEKNPMIDFPYKYIYSPSFEELAKLYCSSHVVVCPSWYESFPAPPLEAMACGVPLVTTTIGTEDYAYNEKNCLVVPPRNSEAMAFAISKLLLDGNLCKKLTEEGLKTAAQFTWDKTTDNVEQLFERVMTDGSFNPTGR